MGAEDVLARAKKRKTEDILGAAKSRQEVKPYEPQSQAETALHSGMQGLSFGLQDEATGLIGGAGAAGAALLEKLGMKEPDPTTEALADPDITGERPDMATAPPVAKGEGDNRRSTLERVLSGYTQARDWERADLHKGERDNPKTALAAELTGSLLAPGPKGTKGATGLKRVGDGIKMGSKMGAAYGFGKSEGGDAGEVALDTVKGAGIGGATGGVLGGISAASRPLLKRIADRRAYKALDPYMKSLDPLMAKSPAGNKMQEADRLGRKALDNELIGFGSSSAGIARKASEAADDTGVMLENSLGRIQDETVGIERGVGYIKGRPVSLSELAQKLANDADEAARAGNQDLARALRSEADDVIATVGARADDSMTLPDAETYKRTLQDRVNYDKSRTMAQPTVDAKKAAASNARQLTEEAVEALAGPEDLSQFKALKQRYGDLATLSDTAGYGSGRLARNNALSLGDQQAAQVGAASGGDLKALLFALTNKMGRERGSSSAAAMADTLQKGGTANLPIGGATAIGADLGAQATS